MQSQDRACEAHSSEEKRERIEVCTWAIPDACDVEGGKREGVEAVCVGVGPALNIASQSLRSTSHTAELCFDLGREW